VDVIGLGPRVVVYNGKERLAQQVRFVFETQVPGSPPRYLARTFTASLNVNARLNEFLGQWRGKPILPGDTLDLQKLIGVSATLVISHQPRRDGDGIFAAIDGVSRPTKPLVPSGAYDRAAAHARVAEENARFTAPRRAASQSFAAPATGNLASQTPAVETGIDDVPF